MQKAITSQVSKLSELCEDEFLRSRQGLIHFRQQLIDVRSLMASASVRIKRELSVSDVLVVSRVLKARSPSAAVPSTPLLMLCDQATISPPVMPLEFDAIDPFCRSCDTFRDQHIV